MSSRRTAMSSRRPAERTGTRWTTDLRYGVQRRICAAMSTTDAAILMAVIREPAARIPADVGTVVVRTPDPHRVARISHVQPSTVAAANRRMIAAGWLRRHPRGWVDGPLLTDAIAAAGEPDAGRDRLHTRVDISTLTARLAADAEQDPDRPDRPGPAELVVIEAMHAIAADGPMMDRPQAAIAELTGIDEADVCRSMQRLERWGLITLGRRHMVTDPGDPNPRALRLGAALALEHHDLLPDNHRPEAARWCSRHGRDRPAPQPPTLPGMRPRHQRASRSGASARRLAISRQRAAAAAHTHHRQHQTRAEIAAMVDAAPFAAGTDPEPPTPHRRT